jgi:HAD superfamily hydrolase (TIGR01509 family)
MKSVFFGSIGAVVESSEIQRQAYNAAFEEAGLAWHWSETTYRQLLGLTGGKARLRLLGDATGNPLSPDMIDRIHTRKTVLASRALVSSGLELRPGVEALARAVKAAGGQLGFVTSTYRANIDAVLALGHAGFNAEALDVVIARDDVAAGKPAPDPYLKALEKTGLAPGDVVVIEDTVASARSARRAGLCVVLTPGAFATETDPGEADLVIPSLLGETGALDADLQDLLGG